MIEKQAAPTRAAGWISVWNTSEERLWRLQREIAPIMRPQPVRQTMRLHRMEALEIQKRLDEPVARRVTVAHGGEIGTKILSESRLVAHGLGKHLADRSKGSAGCASRAATRWITACSKCRLVQHRGDHQPAERRFGRQRGLGFLLDRGPDRIDLVQTSREGRRRCSCDMFKPSAALPRPKCFGQACADVALTGTRASHFRPGNAERENWSRGVGGCQEAAQGRMNQDVMRLNHFANRIGAKPSGVTAFFVLRAA